MGNMKKNVMFLVLIFLFVSGAYNLSYDQTGGGGGPGGAGGGGPGGAGGGGGGGGESEDWFMLKESLDVVRTLGGGVKVVKGKMVNDKPMHIGFITMEPRTLFVPHYLDSTLILFIRRGEVRVGSIYKDSLAEQRLKHGDVFRIEAGSVFYLENIGEGQRLHIICSIDTSESTTWQSFQPFFIGGGTNPKSILAGFDPMTLSRAFNVSLEELTPLMTSQGFGPIVYLSPDSHPPSTWTRFLQLNQHEKLAHMKKITTSFGVAQSDDVQSDDQEKEGRMIWSFRKLLLFLQGKRDDSRDSKRSDDRRTRTQLESINLYDRKPDFKNDYGWSLAIDKSSFEPLGRAGVGVYLVNLTAGSMMAPHINPTATEYGIVLRGSGTIQIVYPNGKLAANKVVNEGDVYIVPRYFPFCQIASRTGPFEIFGFTTSAHKNRPQFLVGSNSLLQTMKSPELAAAFGLSEERFNQLISAQHEGRILPTASVAPPQLKVRVTDDEEEKENKEIIPKLVSKFDEFMGV